MTLTIDLPPDLVKDLQEQAGRSGQDLHAFVVQALQEKIARGRTFDEVCAPFVRAVEATGISEAEYDRFFEEVRAGISHQSGGAP